MKNDSERRRSASQYYQVSIFYDIIAIKVIYFTLVSNSTIVLKLL